MSKHKEHHQIDWRQKAIIQKTDTHSWEVIWTTHDAPYKEYRLSADIRFVGWVAAPYGPAPTTKFGTREFAEETLADAAPPPGVTPICYH